MRILRAARPDGRPVTLKSRFTFSRRVDTVYESAVAATKEELASAAGRLHLVLDLWSERHSKVGYVALLVSFVDDTWQLRIRLRRPPPPLLL